MGSPSVHLPVMFREVLHYLQLSEGLSVMDGTVGAAGHSQKILEQIGSSGQLFGFDRDPMMLDHARQKITQTSDQTNIQLFHSSYADAPEVFANAAINGVDRV
ncbi:MAG: 16S rRNA (cytosine(1402)-N(4))-methyltransferase, partial [Fuerstiella sp.]